VQTYVIYATEPDPNGSQPVYSKADAAVTPPRQVYPALPAEPSGATLKGALTVVDLIVAPDGLVEKVHLRTTPRTIHEFMLLSAVKAWRFQPATLDGRPVRFRHSVALTSFQ
jgi:protein TonB